MHTLCSDHNNSLHTTQSMLSYVAWSDNLNSLAPGRFDYSLKLVTFKLISKINILNIFCEIAIRWMPQNLTDH